MGLSTPHFYSSHGFPSLNTQGTTYQRIGLFVTNAIAGNVHKLKKIRISLEQTVKLDNVCFITGLKSANLQDIYSLKSLTLLNILSNSQ